MSAKAKEVSSLAYQLKAVQNKMSYDHKNIFKWSRVCIKTALGANKSGLYRQVACSGCY